MSSPPTPPHIPSPAPPEPAHHDPAAAAAAADDNGAPPLELETSPPAADEEDHEGIKAELPPPPSDDEAEALQKSVTATRRASEGFVAFNKTLADCEVTPEATNPVKKDTTTKGGKVNLSPMTPLRGIAGASVQVLKIDDLRMFCARNGIKGSRKAKKADVCWAICKAKEAFLAGRHPPYKGLIPSAEGLDDDVDGVHHGAGAAVGLVGDSLNLQAWAHDEVHDATARSSKKRRADDPSGLREMGMLSHPPPPPHASGGGGGGGGAPLMPGGGLPYAKHQRLHTNEIWILQRRLVNSREETNRAVQLRETIESAAGLRREVREERDRRASMWSDLVEVVGGDEGVATERVKSARAARGNNGGERNDEGEVKGSYETLIENLIEQDDLVRKLSRQHDALRRVVDRLIAKDEKSNAPVPVEENVDASEIDV